MDSQKAGSPTCNRDLKLLVGSGGLDFTKGMDFSDKHVEQISSRRKAGSPTSNALLRQAQSRQLFTGLRQSHVTSESTINIL